MHTRCIGYGIDSNSGKPYAQGCQGKVSFDTVEDLVSFVTARVRTLAGNDHSAWQSWDADVKACNGQPDRFHDDIPF